METERKVRALVTGHGMPVTVKELEKVKTPSPTETWLPIPHVEVPQLINKQVTQNGWKIIKDEKTNKLFNMIMSFDGSKLFGVCRIAIPGIHEEDFELALGFRNSHDKTLALRIAVGSNVCICSNLMITGDIQIRRIHTIHISTLEAVTAAFEMVPNAAKSLFQWMNDLRTIPITEPDGLLFLDKAVEVRALAKPDLKIAQESFKTAVKGENPAIAYGNTMWGVYQAITETWKHRSLRWNQNLSQNLNNIVIEKTGVKLIGTPSEPVEQDVIEAG